MPYEVEQALEDQREREREGGEGHVTSNQVKSDFTERNPSLCSVRNGGQVETKINYWLVYKYCN